MEVNNTSRTGRFTPRDWSHGRARGEPDGPRAETTFCLPPKRTSPFKSAGESVQSSAGSRGVRISVCNAGYTTCRGGVRVLVTPSIRQFPLHFPIPCVTVCHHIPNTVLNWGLSRSPEPALTFRRIKNILVAAWKRNAVFSFPALSLVNIQTTLSQLDKTQNKLQFCHPTLCTSIFEVFFLHMCR